VSRYRRRPRAAAALRPVRNSTTRNAHQQRDRTKCAAFQPNTRMWSPGFTNSQPGTTKLAHTRAWRSGAQSPCVRSESPPRCQERPSATRSISEANPPRARTAVRNMHARAASRRPPVEGANAEEATSDCSLLLFTQCMRFFGSAHGCADVDCAGACVHATSR
jgi:hypothetical protein